MEDKSILKIEGFTQNGLIMSDSTMSIDSTDSTNLDLKMSIPEVSYTDYESTVFTFKNLDLGILPSADPQSLELSALMDSLEIITNRDYVNLKGLNLYSKTYPNDGVYINIAISNFLYPNFNNATLSFEDLDFDLKIGIDGEKLAVSVNIPTLSIINKDYRVILSDLNLNLFLHDLKLADFDLSITMSDFHYTNFDDVVLYMDDINVSLVPILNSNSFDIDIGMNGFDVRGITFNELFPMLNIDTINIKNPTDDTELPIKMTGHISPLDVTKIDMLTLGALLSSGFDMETYTRNMSSLYNQSADFELLGIDIVSIFENFDYSSLDSIVLNLADMLDLIDVDLADFGIELSDYDLSAISVADIFSAISDSDYSLSTIKSLFNLLRFDSENLDMSGLISFDLDNFDISSLLDSLNISGEDVSAIGKMLEDSDIDLGSIFKNGDFSCLCSIKLNLSGLLDSIGIDPADFGIDLSDYDLSEIKLTELIDIVSDFDIDMTTVTAMLKLFDVDLDGMDISGLIANFDVENFDISTLLASLNISGLDISGIIDALENSDLDLCKIFENFDVSLLDGITLNFTGLIDSIGIDLSALGIDLSDYDLSSMKISDILAIISNYNIDLNTILAVLKIFDIDLEEIYLSDLIAGFDLDNFDISTLLASLNLSIEDISGLLEILNNSDLDLNGMFENIDLSCLAAIELNLTGVLDSIGIDLSALDIDLSGYDLSAIKVTDLMGILNNFDFDMNTISALLKLLGLDLEEIDLSGLIAVFDEENFDMSSLLASLNLSTDDIAGIMEIFNNSDLDINGIFENADFSFLDAIVLDLTGLIESIDMDLSALGIDLSDYDISAIKATELMGILSNSEINMEDIAAMLMSGDEPITIGEGVTDATDKYYHVDSNVADVNFNEDTGKWEYQGLEIKYYNKDKHDGKLSKKEVEEYNENCKNSALDLSGIDLSSLIASFDEENFDMTGFINSLDLSPEDISGILDNFNESDIDFASIFENADFSCMDAIVLDLSGLINSIGIDLADLGIDLSDFDLSAIKVTELMGILSNFNLDMNTISAALKLFGLDLEQIDMSGLISGFDEGNFDISSLLASLNISIEDISGIMEIFNNSDLDLNSIFENADFSCLAAIELNLTGVLDSIGIDLADLGIDLSDYDLSAIKVTELMAIVGNFNIDMNTVAAVLNLLGIDISELDLSGLLASFDEGSFDLDSIFGSLDLSGLDLSAVAGLLESVAGVFENIDYSCLNAIGLNLTGLSESSNIDLSALAELGIDFSKYDLTAITMADMLDILNKCKFDMNMVIAALKLFGIDISELDLSGLIASFDEENFDMSSLIGNLDLSGLDISGILEMFNNLDIDFEGIFENFDYSCLGAIELDLSELIDAEEIDLTAFGIDLSGYDLSAISLAEIMDLLTNSDVIKSGISAALNLFNLDWEEINWSGMLVSFDVDELDVSALLTSINIPGIDISEVLAMFNMNGIDISEFLKQILSMFMANSVPELTE